MTGKERLENMINGKAVDKLPNLTIIGATPTLITNVKISDWCQDYRLLAEAAIVSSDKFKIDYYQVQSDTHREAVDFGCEIEYHNDKLPAIHKAILNTPEDMAKLVPLKIENCPRMIDTVKAVEILAKQNDKHLMPLVMGSTSVLGSLRDVSNLMMDFYDDPDMVVELLDIIAETQLQFIDEIVKAGSKFIYIADPVASLVSPDTYEEYILPNQKKVIEHCKKLGAMVRLHMCGNTNRIIPFAMDSGTDILDVDHPVDYARACELANSHCIINGNIDPVSKVYSSNPTDIHRAIADCYTKANGNPCMIMPGCELPVDTKVENIIAIHEGISALSL